ncbi:unnamed protein product [Angiostrongylus costaricensis]|uniref:DM domain-containing protein n=1 Tax=Angiostrongylus costaricensis TaxID=334426 RepID=A0A0R3PWE3_ANGCS|nr:unnamed protein product [Angiostrongylus costaricensis]
MNFSDFHFFLSRRVFICPILCQGYFGTNSLLFLFFFNTLLLIKSVFKERHNKKIYFCQRCLNHGSRLPRKNHKCECPYAECKCEYCFLVEKRRQLNSQLHNLEGVDTESIMPIDNDDESPPPPSSEVDRMVRVKGG